MEFGLLSVVDAPQRGINSGFFGTDTLARAASIFSSLPFSSRFALSNHAFWGGWHGVFWAVIACIRTEREKKGAGL